MKNEFCDLLGQFLKIKRMGWIKSKRAGTTGVGYTFESLINKKEDNLPRPDYKNIEIKAMRKFRLNKIHLFCCTPNSIDNKAIEEIIKYLGYPDKDLPYIKIFNMDVYGDIFNYVGKYKKIKLSINENDNKLELVAYTIYNKKIPLNIWWDLCDLNNRMNTKLQYLAIIIADSKTFNSNEYFLFNKILFFRYKGFDAFKKAIQDGNVFITFTVGIFKKGKRIGQRHDHGTNFSLQIENIESIYERIFI